MVKRSVILFVIKLIKFTMFLSKMSFTDSLYLCVTRNIVKLDRICT